jgi:hypothetical protein
VAAVLPTVPPAAPLNWSSLLFDSVSSRATALLVFTIYGIILPVRVKTYASRCRASARMPLSLSI